MIKFRIVKISDNSTLNKIYTLYIYCRCVYISYKIDVTYTLFNYLCDFIDRYYLIYQFIK